MRYVILRDDDTCALTPAECLDVLYRPFLDRNMPVNLATIPEVTPTARKANGEREGFLVYSAAAAGTPVPIGENRELTRYLLEHECYKVVQHGLNHSFHEFNSVCRADVARRLDRGSELLKAAGFEQPRTFVAPYDRLSKVSLREVARRFPVLSTGWFELRRLPFSWWPSYCLKKLRSVSHWRVGRTLLLTHPGCLLSCDRDYGQILDMVRAHVEANALTVLVTHWWEYFRGRKPDTALIGFLHETADYLSKRADVKVIGFDDLASGRVEFN